MPTPRLAGPVAILALVGLSACATSPSPKEVVEAKVKVTGKAEYGVASWHGPSPSSHQSRTASGRRWTNGDLICAHKSLPLGSYVKVTHLRTNKTVVVQIVDRGPYVRGRIVDLSPRAAAALGITGSGVAQVKLEMVSL